MSSQEATKAMRVIDLDVDIGADAVDYKYVALSFTSLLFLIRLFAVPLPIKNLSQVSKQKCAN